MPKLHELLAVDQNLRSQAESCRADLANTFEKKTQHFQEALVTFKSNTEGTPDKVESRLSLQTTVHKELDWISQKLSAALDVGHQIDVANTTAKSDVVLEDGTVLLKDVPATSLLQLEKRVAEIQDLANRIPTLDPSKGFEVDPSKGSDIYKAREEEKPRTKKEFRFIVMVPPTDKHAAQVKELMEDVPVGTLLVQEWSSLITVNEKAQILDRIESVRRAVKQARARANEIDMDVRTNKIGQRILDYVFKGTR